MKEGEEDEEEEDEEEEEIERGRRPRHARRRRPLQRCFGWFRCRDCGRHWESSQVSRFLGTLAVPYKQACKKCHDRLKVPFFTGPYRTQCYWCGSEHSCYCPYDSDDEDEEEGNVLEDEEGREEEEDEEVRGLHIDKRKPHLAHLCEKCVKGFTCGAKEPI